MSVTSADPTPQPAESSRISGPRMVLTLLISPSGMLRTRPVAARPTMLTPALIFALAVTCLAVQGCLLFTPAVNEAPTIKIVPHVGSMARGKPVEVVANASDPDGDPPRVEWAKAMGKCQSPLDAGQRAQTTFVSPP